MLTLMRSKREKSPRATFNMSASYLLPLNVLILGMVVGCRSLLLSMTLSVLISALFSLIDPVSEISSDMSFSLLRFVIVESVEESEEESSLLESR